MDRRITRSSTFVFDETDHATLLPITHSVIVPQSTDVTFGQVDDPKHISGKERTKRSLSPILLGSTVTKQKIIKTADKNQLSTVPASSTPRYQCDAGTNHMYSERAVNKPHVSLEMQTFLLDNTKVQFDASMGNSSPPVAETVHSNATVTKSSKQQTDTVVRSTNTTCTTVENNDAFVLDGRATQLNAPNSKINGEAERKFFFYLFFSLFSLCMHLSKTSSLYFFFRTVSSIHSTAEKTLPIQIVSGPLNDGKKRFSLGLELTECTLDCSMELCDSSAATSMQDSSPVANHKAHSYELEESLGILTPDQMIEFLDTNASHGNVEIAQHFPLPFPKLKCPVDHTPSPEELPLDPVDVKNSDGNNPDETLIDSSAQKNESKSQCYLFTKAVQSLQSSITKIAIANASTATVAGTVSTANSFITSVTSIASLDNGYQGDGEMSRPASRGAENSPMHRANSRQSKLHPFVVDNLEVVRRPDPMSDSDFFTESDADDVFHRGDRRVQIIDGHMYNAQGADIFIDERQNIESSGMDSSGVYTDVEQPRTEDDVPRLAISTNTSENSPDTVESPNTVSGNSRTLTIMTTDLDAEKSTQTSKVCSALSIQSAQSIGTLSNSSSTTNNDSATTAYLCSGINENIDSDCASSGDVGSGEQYNQQTTIFNDSMPLSRTLCTLHSASHNHNSNHELSNSPKIPQKSTGTKTRRVSSNRKVNKCTNDVSKREEIKSSISRASQNRSHGAMENNKTSESSSLETYATNENVSSGNAAHMRRIVPNKWDAVMNKIAANKANDVKNIDYNQVKSKVACRFGRGTPVQSKTPLSEQSIASGTSSDSTNKSSMFSLDGQSPFGMRKR